MVQLFYFTCPIDVGLQKPVKKVSRTAIIGLNVMLPGPSDKYRILNFNKTHELLNIFVFRYHTPTNMRIKFKAHCSHILKTESLNKFLIL